MFQAEYTLSDFKPTKGYDGISMPYCVAFVYARNQGNVIVRGMTEEVKKYVQTYLTPCFWRCTFWKNGRSRGGWRFEGVNIWARKVAFKQGFPYRGLNFDVVTGERIKRQRNYSRFKYVLVGGNNKVTILVTRRMPNKWLPIFDAFLKNPVSERPVKQETLFGTVESEW